MNEHHERSNRIKDMQYHDYITSNSQKSIPKVLKSYMQPCSSPSNLFHSIKSFFPIISWIQEYPSKYLIHDIISGIVIAILHIPQGISYAFLSKVNPVNGLYASFFAPLIYLFFATSKHMSVGSFAVIALMTGAATYHWCYFDSFLCIFSDPLVGGIFYLGFCACSRSQFNV
uniref:SLC26A/SulP transporter domain-containing protein n=1 Tax=Panagrolaimus superbus TaxID=310955 RepID=A0A914Z527_9BILA